jgi:hypothetical protein
LHRKTRKNSVRVEEWVANWEVHAITKFLFPFLSFLKIEYQTEYQTVTFFISQTFHVGHNHRFLKHADKTSLHKETTQKSAQFSNENFSHFLNFFLHSFSSASLKPYSSSHLALNSLDNALVNHTVGRQRSVTLQLPSIEEQSLLTHWHAVDGLDLFHEIEDSGGGGQAD